MHLKTWKEKKIIIKDTEKFKIAYDRVKWKKEHTKKLQQQRFKSTFKATKQKKTNIIIDHIPLERRKESSDSVSVVFKFAASDYYYFAMGKIL